MSSSNRVLGGILLVSGTTIGAAMLALPVTTGLAGYFPAVLLFLVFWAYMTYTAFLILEVNLWMAHDDANMITMARKTLGVPGQIFAWITYLFLLYMLNTAYLSVSGPIFLEALKGVLGWDLPNWAGPVPLLIIFSLSVVGGTSAVDKFNRWLMCGMILTYVLLMVGTIPHVEMTLLKRTDWTLLLIGVSVVATSFGFHIIIPTLSIYLERNLKDLKKVLIIGSTIPLLVYLFWEGLALSIVPFGGSQGLLAGFYQGADGATLMAAALDIPWLRLVARCFLFFAIVTSFLGVSLGLWDFLADGLKVQKRGNGRLWLYVLTFLPPLVFALLNPRAFLTAIEYAGAFGVVTLLGLLPALMVWFGRARLKQVTEGRSAIYRTPGGKPALLAVILFSLGVMAIEICYKTGVFNLPQEIGSVL